MYKIHLPIFLIFFHAHQLFDFSLTTQFFSNFHIVRGASVEAENRTEYHAGTDDQGSGDRGTIGDSFGSG